MIRIGSKLDANSRNINFDYQGNIVKKKPVNHERLPLVFETVDFQVKRPDEMRQTGMTEVSQKEARKEGKSKTRKTAKSGIKKKKVEEEVKEVSPQEDDSREQGHETVVMHNQPAKKSRRLEPEKENSAAQDLLRKLKFSKGVSMKE